MSEQEKPEDEDVFDPFAELGDEVIERFFSNDDDDDTDDDAIDDLDLSDFLGTNDEAVLKDMSSLPEGDRRCLFTSQTDCVKELVVRYGQGQEGPHRIVFYGSRNTWRSGCAVAMTRIWSGVVEELQAQNVPRDQWPPRPKLYFTDWRSEEGGYHSVHATMTTTPMEQTNSMLAHFTRKAPRNA